MHACDILVDEVRAYARQFDGEGMIRPVWVDVTDPRSVAGVIEAAEAGTGAVDVLVYVAGGVRGQAPLPVDEVQADDFHDIVEANLAGAFLFARAIAPGMKRAGRGRIVTISSRAGLATTLTGVPELRRREARPGRAREAAWRRARAFRHHRELGRAGLHGDEPRTISASGTAAAEPHAVLVKLLHDEVVPLMPVDGMAVEGLAHLGCSTLSTTWITPFDW